MTIITNLDREENLTSVCSVCKEAHSKIIEQIKKGFVLDVIELCTAENWSDRGVIARVGGYRTPARRENWSPSLVPASEKHLERLQYRLLQGKVSCPSIRVLME